MDSFEALDHKLNLAAQAEEEAEALGQINGTEESHSPVSPNAQLDSSQEKLETY
jgi:hypothetical protein